MSPVSIGLVVLVCTFGGALLGMRLRSVLPDSHLSAEARDTVNLGIGLIAMMTALVLGLVTASAKDAFDTLDKEIKHTAAELLSLDRVLARYGPETGAIRQAIRNAIKYRVDMLWPRGGPKSDALDPTEATVGVESLSTRLRELTPRTEEQRWLQSRALNLGEILLQSRWQLFAGLGPSVPGPFLAILIFWLAITFTSFGLFAPHNPTVITVLFVCALSVASAVFLVLELDGPFEGLIRVSADPLRFAIAHMGQ